MAPEMETVVHCLESFREIMTNNSLEEFYFFFSLCFEMCYSGFYLLNHSLWLPGSWAASITAFLSSHVPLTQFPPGKASGRQHVAVQHRCSQSR